MAAGIDVKSGGHVSQKDNQQRLVFACTYTLSAATMHHGEENYMHTSGSIAPSNQLAPSGTRCIFIITNKAKHNSMGNLEYIAVAPHVDPMMDQSFWHGLLWLHLLLVAGFEFPDFGNWKELFLLPTYPTPRAFKHFSRQQYR
jgi:hypothetical protein